MTVRCLAAWWAVALLSGSVSADSMRPGFAGLYKVDSTVVVYPAGPPEAAATNRRSADQRASLLRTVYGMEVRVVADDRLEAADLADHLLVLGWDNRVLGTERAPRPFERAPGKLVFAGREAPSDGVDLAFRVASPFASGRTLAFWSRIDPELDRMQLLPSFGSDWALYREFLPIAQGMFASAKDWPPQRDVDAEHDRGEILASSRGKRARVADGPVSVVFDPEAVAEPEARQILSARRAALAEAQRALGVSVADLRVRVEVYEDEHAKDELTGIPAPAHSIARDGTLHVVRRGAASTGFHEEIHLVAERAYGPTRSTALYEGLAVAADGAYRGRDLDTHAGILVETQRIPPVADLLDEGRIRGLPDDVALPAAGLLVRFLRERGGDAAVRTAYVAAEPDPAAAAGIPASRLDEQFRAWLTTRSAAGAAEVAFLKKMAEAQSAHADSDYAALARILREALAVKPNEPQTLFNLAAAEMRLGEYDAAERELRAVLASGLPQEHDLVVFSYLQLARVEDLRGRRDDALAHYREVLARKDRHDSHLSASEGLERPFTSDRLE